MPLDAPFHDDDSRSSSFRLGPFQVAGDGRLALAEPDCLPRFNLSWRGCRVDASLLPAPTSHQPGEPDSQGRLELEAELGRVPSTAAPNPPRETVFAALQALQPNLPAGWTLHLLADHRVAIAATRHVPLPSTVTVLLAEVTMFLLEVTPYLELLAEVGVEPAAGMAKT